MLSRKHMRSLVARFKEGVKTMENKDYMIQIPYSRAMELVEKSERAAAVIRIIESGRYISLDDVADILGAKRGEKVERT